MDMASIYYKNDVPIPALIHVTGPNSDLTINLFKDYFGYMGLLDVINLKHERDFKLEFGDYLVGKSLDRGTYIVFINTTDLTEGYYELSGWRPGFDKTYGARGFYLLNSSPQPVTEKLNTS